MEATQENKREGVVFSARLPYYDTPEGKRLLMQLAKSRGVKATQLIRTLIREEGVRCGIEDLTCL